MGKKHNKKHNKKLININSKEYKELMLIKNTLLKAKKMLEDAKTTMDKYADEQNEQAASLHNLIIFKKD